MPSGLRCSCMIDVGMPRFLACSIAVSVNWGLCVVAIIWVPCFLAVLRMALAGASRLWGYFGFGSSIRSSLGSSASIAIVVRAAVFGSVAYVVDSY